MNKMRASDRHLKNKARHNTIVYRSGTPSILHLLLHSSIARSSWIHHQNFRGHTQLGPSTYGSTGYRRVFRREIDEKIPGSWPLVGFSFEWLCEFREYCLCRMLVPRQLVLRVNNGAVRDRFNLLLPHNGQKIKDQEKAKGLLKQSYNPFQKLSRQLRKTVLFR